MLGIMIKLDGGRFGMIGGMVAGQGDSFLPVSRMLRKFFTSSPTQW